MNLLLNPSIKILPLRYRLYQPIHTVLSHFQSWKVLQKHPFVVAKNYLNRLMFSYVFTEDQQYIIKTKDGFVIRVPLNDQAAASIIFEHQYSIQQITGLLRLLRYCSAFLDIGANLGYFSLFALTQMGQNYPVVAVEPNRKLCQLMRDSMELNQFHTGQIVCAAVGQQPGWGQLKLKENLSSNAQVLPSHSITANEAVEIVTVDHLIQVKNLQGHTWLIKVDVEGDEINVLKGCQNTLKQGAILMLEVDRHLVNDLKEILTEHDYQCIDLNGNSIELLKIRNRKTDVILVPTSMSSSIIALLA